MKGERSLHVLIVDDSPEDRNLYRRLLSESRAGTFEFTEAETGEEGLTLLRSGGVDCVLLDYLLPDVDGLEFLSTLISENPDVSVPIVMLTGHGSEAIAIEAMRRGAQDYIIKSEVKRNVLERTIRYAIERQRLQTELNQRARHQIELKNRFLSHVSHELRSPLTVVYQFVTIVLDGLAGPTNEEQQEYLETALRNVQQLQGMIDDLLEATRADTGKLSFEPERLDIAPLVADEVRSLQATAAEKGITLEHIAAGDLPPTCADPVRIRQVLVNLVDNALKFTPAGGSVRVRTSRDAHDERAICVSVQDDGCGIGMESRERIFDRLHQEETIIEASRRGLGLGLYIAKQLVSLHGGNIWLEGEPERGTIVCFSLPIFSLSQLLEPALIENGRLRETIAVVNVHMHPANGGSAAHLSPIVSAEASSIVQNCVLPDLDIVLPHLTRSERLRSVHVVACTDDAGADVLAARIRGQLQRSAILRESGIRTEITARVVDVRAARSCGSLDEALDRVAHAIEQVIAAELRQAEIVLRERPEAA